MSNNVGVAVELSHITVRLCKGKRMREKITTIHRTHTHTHTHTHTRNTLSLKPNAKVDVVLGADLAGRIVAHASAVFEELRPKHRVRCRGGRAPRLGNR
jgi:hypothetical protein